jgi:hypothetical protein
MSNQLKLAAIVIIIIIIGSGSIFISGVFKPKKDDKLAQVNSSSVALVSSQNASTSSTQVSSKVVSAENQVSSTPSFQSSSKAVEVVSSKAKVEISAVPNQSVNCNIITSTNWTNNDLSFYYQPENRCVKISYSGYEYGNLFKGGNFANKEFEKNRLYLTDFNIKLANSIATDYVTSVKPKIITKDFEVFIDTKEKIDNNFTIRIYANDPEYLKINPNAETNFGLTVPRFEYEYFIYQDSNNNWTWKFNRIVKE